MRQQHFINTVRNTMLTVLATVLGFWASAQDAPSANIKVSTTESSSTSQMWYTSPWVWVVGAAIFILLLVALLNNRRGNRVD